MPLNDDLTTPWTPPTEATGPELGHGSDPYHVDPYYPDPYA